MSNRTTISVEGIGAANKMLAQLNDFPRQQKQLVQAAGRAALRPTVQAMRASTPISGKPTYTSRGFTRRSGDARRSIGTKTARKSPTVIAGPRRSKQHLGFYLTMVEYGTKDRVRKDGRRTGRISAGINRIGKAAQATKPQVMRIYTDQVQSRFFKYAKKVGLQR